MFADFGIVNIWTYVIGTLIIVMVPGPESIFVLKAGMTGGIRRGYSAVLAVLLSDVILILLAWAGVATLVTASPFLFDMVKYAGAAYLFWLGIQTLWTAIFRRQDTDGTPDSRTGKSIIGRGMLVTLLNPKSLLFYLSFFVQFVDASAPHSWMAFTILASILFVITIAWFSVLIFTGSFLVEKLKGNRKLSVLGNSLVSFFFIGFAARLATTQA